MNCREAGKFLYAFADGELETRDNLQVLEHVNMCQECCGRVSRQQQLKAAIASSFCNEQAPLSLRDRIISVSLVGIRPDGNWAWRDLSDGVPALGAVPTLKWIHESTVLDRHRLSVPGDAPSAPAQAQIQVYDHFTQAVLPSLDARLRLGGAGIPLHTWSVDGPLEK